MIAFGLAGFAVVVFLLMGGRERATAAPEEAAYLEGGAASPGGPSDDGSGPSDDGSGSSDDGFALVDAAREGEESAPHPSPRRA